MLKIVRTTLLFLPVLLNAGFFDWYETLSPKAEKAKARLENIDSVLEKAVADYDVPGLAIGVIVDGHVIYTKGFGYRNLEEKLPVTAQTLFPIGSCTKAFTTFAMGNLVEEGRFEWDQPVIDILPEFRLWDQYATTNVTFRDLLTHRTGMPRHEFVWYNSKMTKEEMLKRIRFLQPAHDIRQKYQYGNLMYFIAGLSMEKMAGKSWEQIIQERILTPLEMKNTHCSFSLLQQSDNVAYPYLERSGKIKRMPFRDLSLISAAGGINSNVEDLTHWLQMLTNGGVYHSSSLISPATLQELLAPNVIIPGAPECKDSLLYAYGFGWGINSYSGYYYVSHDGVSDGFTTVLGFLPKENIGVVVLANKNMTSLARYASLQILDAVLDLPFHDWIQEGLDGILKNRQILSEKSIEEDLSRKKGTTPSHPLEEYVGVYENPGYGKMEVVIVDGKLQAVYNDLTFVLDHWHYDVFRVIEEKQDMIVSFEGAKITFANNADGDIAEIIAPFEPIADDIVFKRKSEEKLSNLNYLRQFTGIYEIYGYTVEVAIRNQALVAIIPGQSNYELTPVHENEFSVKSLTGSTVRFVMDQEKKIREILLIHPYGVFSANPKR